MKSRREIDEIARTFTKEHVYHSKLNETRKKVNAAINIIIIILSLTAVYLFVTIIEELALIITLTIFIISIYLAKSQEKITMYFMRKYKI